MAQPMLPRNPGPLGTLFEHTMVTDPNASWLAETTSGEVIGFGLAHRRSGAWFLGFLFVRSDHQADGVGRRLLEACVGGGQDAVRATCIEAIQPISAGLYASFGMLPRVPLFVMTGGVPREPLAPMHELVAVPFAEPGPAGNDALAAAVDAIDREILGYAHRDDHEMWASAGRNGYLFRHRESDETAGYGYVSGSGRVAPVAVRDERWLPEAIDHLMATVEGPEKWVLFVPGPSSALAPLLGAGFRFDGPPAIYCSTGAGPAFERYLVGTFALL